MRAESLLELEVRVEALAKAGRIRMVEDLAPEGVTPRLGAIGLDDEAHDALAAWADALEAKGSS